MDTQRDRDIFALIPGDLSADTFRRQTCEGCYFNRGPRNVDPETGNCRKAQCKVVNTLLEAFLSGKPAPAELDVIEVEQANLLPGAPQSYKKVVCQRFKTKEMMPKRRRRRRGAKVLPGQLALFG